MSFYMARRDSETNSMARNAYHSAQTALTLGLILFGFGKVLGVESGRDARATANPLSRAASTRGSAPNVDANALPQPSGEPTTNNSGATVATDDIPPPMRQLAGPPNRRMTELTIDTAVHQQERPSDEIATFEGDSAPLLTFDTPFTNRDLRFSYENRALGFQHHPLYFEDVALERYGSSCGPLLDPLISGCHFYGTIGILPYKMAVRHPDHPVATYGRRTDFYRSQYRDGRLWPSHPTVRSCMGVCVETLIVSALVFGL